VTFLPRNMHMIITYRTPEAPKLYTELTENEGHSGAVGGRPWGAGGMSPNCPPKPA
jgi:hypothetical protein